MKASIIGTGWVTPLGREVEEVWQAVQQGARPEISTPMGSREWPVWPIPQALVAAEQALPRLRRSSVISHFAVAAARDAVAMAGLNAEELSRCALIFASSDGGVVYTRRFYADIVENGPATGSPLLFPETVYNAPASHVAASLGLAGEVLTLVGDGTVGLAAMHVAGELLAGDALDHCLVVTSQELDWISVEAYGRWNLIQGGTDLGAVPFAEGAAALVLARRNGPVQVSFSHAGFSYSTKSEARTRMHAMLAAAPEADRPGMIVSSDGGGEFHQIERELCGELYPEAAVWKPKSSLGEALAVSTLQQVIIAHRVLQEKPGNALIPAIGFNGQLGALILTGGGAGSQDSRLSSQ